MARVALQGTVSNHLFQITTNSLLGNAGKQKKKKTLETQNKIDAWEKAEDPFLVGSHSKEISRRETPRNQNAKE